MNARALSSFALRLLLVPCLLAALPARATYSCNLVVTSLGVIYQPGRRNRVDATGTVTLTCTRDVATDANSLTYRIGVDYGRNFQGGQRNARRGGSPDLLAYSIRRGLRPGGAARCRNASNWGLPVVSSGVMRGRLEFGSAATASVYWGFCVRVRGNQGSPTAGQYVDTLFAVAQYPEELFGAVALGSFTYTIGVDNQCVFNSRPTGMSFHYDSFQPAPQETRQVVRIACSSNLPWSLAIMPDTGSLLGLDYTLAASPAVGTGTGLPQDITITGTMPAGQHGTCGTARCSARQPHTLTISY